MAGRHQDFFPSSILLPSAHCSSPLPAMSTSAGGSSASAPAASVPAIPRMPPHVLGLRSAEGWNVFSEATQVVLSRWHLLRTAVSERWGGARSQSRYELLVDDLMTNLDEQWREGNDVHEDTLDVYLLECLTSYFNVDFEGGDDSVVTEVSLVIQELYRKCASGDLSKAKELVASPDTFALRQGAVRAATASDDEEEDEEGEEEEEGEEAMVGGGGGSSSSSSSAAVGGGGGGGGGGGSKREVDEDGWETVGTKKGGKGGGGKGKKGMDEE